MASRRHLIRNRDVEILAGLGALVLAAMLLKDAFEGRGHDQPRLLRPFSFW